MLEKEKEVMLPKLAVLKNEMTNIGNGSKLSGCYGGDSDGVGGGGGGGGGGGLSSKRSHRLLRYSLCLILLNLLVVNLVAGQFFTKSSKSIPRMGRRSLPDFKSELEAYQQMLDEENEQQNLINESPTGPRTGTASTLANEDALERGLVSDRNQRLSDLLIPRPLGDRMPRASEEYDVAPKLTRDERAHLPSFSERLAQHRLEATREQAW